MLGIYKVEGGVSKEIPAIEADCWINLADPEMPEIRKVKEALSLPGDFFTDALDPAERPRIETRGDVIFMAIRVSYPTPEGVRPPFMTLPVGIILTPSAIVTVSSSPRIVEKLLASKLPRLNSRDRMRMALALMQQASIGYVQDLEVIDGLTSLVEESMRQSMRNEELARMLHIEKTLVYFVTALKANNGILERLSNSTTIKLNEEERALLLDTVIECKQATETAEIYAQIVSSLSETFASMISNNMNQVMKFLTGITLILMGPSIVVGLFGMNVPLPFEQNAWALPLIVLGTVVICVVLWRYLVHKDWM